MKMCCRICVNISLKGICACHEEWSTRKSFPWTLLPLDADHADDMCADAQHKQLHLTPSPNAMPYESCVKCVTLERKGPTANRN